MTTTPSARARRAQGHRSDPAPAAWSSENEATWTDDVPYGKAMRLFFERYVTGHVRFDHYEVMLERPDPSDPFTISKATGFYCIGDLRQDDRIPLSLTSYGAEAAAELYALHRPEGCLLVQARLDLQGSPARVVFDDHGGLSMIVENEPSVTRRNGRMILRGDALTLPSDPPIWAQFAYTIPRMRTDLVQLLRRYATPATLD